MLPRPDIQKVQLAADFIDAGLTQPCLLSWVRFDIDESLVPLVLVDHVHPSLLVKCTVESPEFCDLDLASNRKYGAFLLPSSLGITEVLPLYEIQPIYFNVEVQSFQIVLIEDAVAVVFVRNLVSLSFIKNPLEAERARVKLFQVSFIGG